jgi:hypothetical protein
MGGTPPPRRAPLRSAAETELEEDSRPTLIPDFDPEAFARDSETRQRAAPQTSGEPTLDDARRCHINGDHERALFLISHVLALDPLHPEATALSAECRAALERECLAAIGSEATVFVASASPEELKGFALDNVSGFLISLMDGRTSVEDLLDIAGLPRLLALRHLRKLVERALVCVASGRTPLPQVERPGSPGQRHGAVDEDYMVESGVLHVRMETPTLDSIPVLLVASEDLDGLNLEWRARMLMNLVNDRARVGEILVATHMDVVEGAALFRQLAEDGLVAFV